MIKTYAEVQEFVQIVNLFIRNEKKVEELKEKKEGLILLNAIQEVTEQLQPALTEMNKETEKLKLKHALTGDKGELLYNERGDDYLQGKEGTEAIIDLFHEQRTRKITFNECYVPVPKDFPFFSIKKSQGFIFEPPKKDEKKK